MISAQKIGSVRKLLEAELGAGKRAVKLSMTQAAVGLKKDWRAEVTRAGLGQRLPRTIRSEAYPKGQDSLNAAAAVWTNAPHILGAFDRGELIRSKDGLWLAIPTEAAGKRGMGGKRITPHRWEQMTGLKLRMIYRQGKSSLLVADGARMDSRGRAVMSRAKVRKDGMQRGAVTAIVFVLVPQVRVRQVLHFVRIGDKWTAHLPDMIVHNWKDV